MIGRVLSASVLQVQRLSFVKKAPYCTVKKVEEEQSLHDFVKNNVESFDSFKNSEIVKKVCGDDTNKIEEVYKQLCEMRYYGYQQERYGGNSSLMV